MFKMATEAAARKFMALPSFAVAGASSNPQKFGHKVHAWYLAHSLEVTPINPSSKTVNVSGEDYGTVPNVTALSRPKETGLSIITAPPVTIGILKEAKAVGIPAIWMQPGTFDEEVLKFALEDGQFQSVVYGAGGRGHDGWCVLVDGDKALREAEKL